jgi:hypothetical protein
VVKISKIPTREVTVGSPLKTDRPIGHRQRDQWRNTASEDPKVRPDDTSDFPLRDLDRKILKELLASDLPRLDRRLPESIDTPFALYARCTLYARRVIRFALFAERLV